MQEPLVQNAADRPQVQRAKRRVQDARFGELSDLRAVLAQPEGRRVLWRLLEHCSVFESIWDPSVRIHVNAGRQDVGHWLMAEIERADDEALFRLMVEAKQRAKRADAETQAGRIDDQRQEQQA